MRRFTISPPIAALILAVVLFLLSGLLPNSYGSDVKVALSQATNILRLSVFLGVIAAGQTLVIISGFEGIDLSAGSIVTLTAILTYVLVKGQDNMVLPALFVSLVVGALIGLLNGTGITFLKISPFVMTLGMSGVVTGAILVWLCRRRRISSAYRFSWASSLPGRRWSSLAALKASISLPAPSSP